MDTWIKNNLWSLLIAGVTIVSTYTLYGYKINDLERRLTVDEATISTLNTQQVQTQVSLAQIQVDLTYIKSSVDRLSNYR